MAKIIDNSVLDAALNEIKNNCDQMVACAGQPATYYEAADPAVWAASTAYSLGDAVRPATRDGRTYECTTAGTSGASEPSFDTTVDNTTADNTATWTTRDDKGLSAVAMVTGDFTIADGDTSGRKVSVAQKTGVSIHTTGTADHVALVDSAAKVLQLVTTATAQGLTSGNTMTFNAFDDEIADPA